MLKQRISIGIALGSLLVLVGAACSTAPQPQAVVPETPAGNTPGSQVTPPVVPPADQGSLKTFTVNAANYSFSLNEIKVKKGDKVKIVFNNQEGTHDWVLDEFNAKTPIVPVGQRAEVQFTADKVGTFEYYCSVGQHRLMGMKGKFIVE